MDQEIEPHLDRPGAGLPKHELIVGRLLFKLGRALGNREAFDDRFRHERQTIRNLVRTCDEESGSRRVLISRAVGMEDSSRYWSIWMTLDHLRIVHESITGIIGSLTSGVIPEGEASTAAVKPSKDATADVLARYEASCDALLATTASPATLETRLKFPHPWFGPLDAAGWQAMAATHLRIHRVQIERILEGLGRAESQRG